MVKKNMLCPDLKAHDETIKSDTKEKYLGDSFEEPVEKSRIWATHGSCTYVIQEH